MEQYVVVAKSEYIAPYVIGHGEVFYSVEEANNYIKERGFTAEYTYTVYKLNSLTT